jgi:putative GTP pyrophosphokinase
MDKEKYGRIDGDKLDKWITDAESGKLSLLLGSVSGEHTAVMEPKGKQMLATFLEYKELMMIYTCAMKEVQTKFEVLSTEFQVRYQRNPIRSMSTRLKKTSAIAGKLAKRDLSFTLKNIEENLHDVAGVRVICAYIDDIYLIADAFLNQDDITLLERKDYIETPKENGYRSLHLIVSVPVFFAEQKKDVKVEVQIRTMAMDFWASLEHQLRYKNRVCGVDGCADVASDLKECADIISHTDERMLWIRKKIEELAEDQSKEEQLLELLSRTDIRIE